MAMNVKFLKGTIAQYNAATKDAGTLYFITDAPSIYLGSELIADKTVLDTNTVNSLVAEALKNFYTKDEIDAFIETINGSIADVDAKFASYRTSAAQDEIDNGIKADIKAIADDYLVEADKTELEGKITAHETAVNTKFNDYSTTVQMNSAISTATTDMATNASVDGKLANYRTSAVQDAIDQAQDKALTDAISAEVQRADGKYEEKGIAQGIVDALKLGETYEPIGAEERAKGYTDEEIIGLEFALSDDGKELSLKNKAGTTVATLNTTDFVVDGMLSEVVVDKSNNTLTFKWNTDSGITETTVALSDIADIYTGSTNADEVNVNVSNENVISATIGANVKTKIDNGNTAYSWGDHSKAGYAKDDELGKLAKKDTVATADIDDDAVTADKLADAINTDIAKGVAAKAVTDTIGDYVKKSDAPGYGDIWTEAEHNTYAAGVSTAIENAEKAAKDHADAEIGKLGTMAKEAASDYTKTADLGDLAFVDTIDALHTPGGQSSIQVYNDVDQGGNELTGAGRVVFADMSAGSWEFSISGGIFKNSVKGGVVEMPTQNGVMALVGDITAAEGRAAADATSKANTAEANAKADATSKANTAEENAKSYADGLLAALRGAASADITIEALVKAINKCIKGTEETTLQTASLTDNINNLDSRADAIEGVLTWGEIK